jgi:hypothetical protein
LYGRRGDEFATVQTTVGFSSLYITKDALPNVSADWIEQGTRLSIDAEYDSSWDFSVIPGLSGNAWQLVHDMVTAYGLVFNPLKFLFTLPTQEQPSAETLSSLVESSQNRDVAETVEVINYDYRHSPNVFEPIQLFKDTSTYSLSLGERQEHIVQTDSTFSMIYQPVCVTREVATQARLDDTYGESLYSVTDSALRQVVPAQWVDGGGFISAEGTGVPGELKLIIQAPTNPLVSVDPPFIISIESTIPSLIIAGVGAVARKETITSYTGAGQGRNIKKLGTTYDNPMVSTSRQAWEVAVKLGSLYGTTPSTVTVNIPDTSVNAFDVPRILHKGATYLPTSWTRQGNMLSINSAVRYTSCGEMNEDYAGMTNAEYNALYSGKTIRYVNISPLKFRRA